MIRRVCCCVKLLALALIAAGGWSADARAATRDPVADAFALPPGVYLTADEMENANRIRARLEPRLRDALRQVENAETEQEKTAAAKQVYEVRKEIQAAIAAILQERARKAAQEAAKRAAEQRKKAAENRKKNQGKKKKKKGGKKRRR